jgi:hypothetical protein
MYHLIEHVETSKENFCRVEEIVERRLLRVNDVVDAWIEFGRILIDFRRILIDARRILLDIRAENVFREMTFVQLQKRLAIFFKLFHKIIPLT